MNGNKTHDTSEFIETTNREFIEWCRSFYNPDALNHRGMISLHALWAWQEQERRKRSMPIQEGSATCYIHKDSLAFLRSRSVDDSSAIVRYANGFPGWVPTHVRDQYIALKIATEQPVVKNDETESKGTIYLGACITDETLYACVMRKEGDVTEFVANAKMDVRSLYSHDCIAKMTNSRSNLDSVRNNTTKIEEK